MAPCWSAWIEIVGLHGHAGDAHLAAKALRMHPGMRRADRAGQRLEARRPLRDVADRAVGDDAEAAERLVHVALHLAPERAVADVGTVDVLDHRDARAVAGADIFVIFDAAPGLLFGRQRGSSAPSGSRPCGHSRRSAAGRGTGRRAAWWCSRSAGARAPRSPWRCRSSGCHSGPALRGRKRAAARSRYSVTAFSPRLAAAVLRCRWHWAI